MMQIYCTMKGGLGFEVVYEIEMEDLWSLKKALILTRKIELWMGLL